MAKGAGEAPEEAKRKRKKAKKAKQGPKAQEEGGPRMPTAKRREKEKPRRKKRKGPLREEADEADEPAAAPAPASASGKRQKRLKLQAHLRIAGAVRTPGALSARPFEALAEDHCETPFQAFQDIEPLLFALAARLKKPKANLRIYDPFYCEGSMVAHLNALGFASVHNRNEDFYEVRRRGAVPDHDVLVTNPPFSGDHVERLLRWAREGNGGRPFLLLLPNFVATKGWFDGDAPWLFVVPAKADYLFWAPGREGGRVRGRHILPKANGKEFPCFWFAGLGEHHAKVLHWWRKTGHRLHGHTVTVAETAAELPRGARAEKRPNPRQRAKARRKQQQQQPGGR